MEESKEITSSGLYTAIWVEFGASTLVTALRLYSQAVIVRKVAIDDVLMLAAWGFQLAASITSTLGTRCGMGRKTLELGYDQVVCVLKYGAFAMPVGALSSMFGRLAFICFLLVSVITVFRYRKWLLWALIVTQVVVNVVPIVMEFTACRPASKLWEVRGPGICKQAEVVQQVGYFQGAFNGLTDLLLTILALFVILSLQMRRNTKITLSILLSLSLFAMIAAILKTVALRKMVEPDLNYAYGMWTIWNLTEGTVVIITASVPRLRPVLSFLKKIGVAFTFKTYSAKPESHHYTGSKDQYKRYHGRVKTDGLSSSQYLPRWPEPLECHSLVERGSMDERAVPLEPMPNIGDVTVTEGPEHVLDHERSPSRSRRSLWSALHLYPGGSHEIEEQGHRRLEIWQRTQISVHVNEIEGPRGTDL